MRSGCRFLSDLQLGVVVVCLLGIAVLLPFALLDLVLSH